MAEHVDVFVFPRRGMRRRVLSASLFEEGVQARDHDVVQFSEQVVIEPACPEHVRLRCR